MSKVASSPVEAGSTSYPTPTLLTPFHFILTSTYQPSCPHRCTLNIYIQTHRYAHQKEGGSLLLRAAEAFLGGGNVAAISSALLCTCSASCHVPTTRHKDKSDPNVLHSIHTTTHPYRRNTRSVAKHTLFCKTRKRFGDSSAMPERVLALHLAKPTRTSPVSLT